MLVYQTNYMGDGRFIAEVKADADPVEEDNWLIPAGCVLVAPPVVEEPSYPRWTGDAWEVFTPPEPEPASVPVPETPEAPVQSLPTLIIVSPADLWRRTTDEEAERIEDAMAAQPARLRNLFRAAQTYQSGDPLWPVLHQTAVELFGEERAGELLAASSP
jgi:hypothetical protein